MSLNYINTILTLVSADIFSLNLSLSDNYGFWIQGLNPNLYSLFACLLFVFSYSCLASMHRPWTIQILWMHRLWVSNWLWVWMWIPVMGYSLSAGSLSWIYKNYVISIFVLIMNSINFSNISSAHALSLKFCSCPTLDYRSRDSGLNSSSMLASVWDFTNFMSSFEYEPQKTIKHTHTGMNLSLILWPIHFTDQSQALNFLRLNSIC